MSIQLTSTDLDQWSNRRDAQGKLPALVRRLLMSTVRPERIRFPAAEGIALPGLDGVLRVSGPAGPYVPAGESVWEASTEARPKPKATRDYTKRTNETTTVERAATTFVFVTSRTFGDADAWVEEMEARGNGWKEIRVIDAQDLATWLETCPGAHAWLSNELGRPLGIVELSQWFDRWSAQTDPTTPAALLLAGRRRDAIDLLNELDGHPSPIERCAGSVEEVVAFIAATLRQGPAREPAAADGSVSPSVDEGDTNGVPEDEDVLTRAREPEEFEALLARCLVVEGEDAWRHWSRHDHPQILIPLFYPDSVQAAVKAGHHVVLPRISRGAHDRGRLALLQVDAARTAWTDAGLDFRVAGEYAIASRRNLRSLRRRIARHRRHQMPEWGSGPSASLLATVLLAGEWDTNYEGDLEVVLALTERASWRALARDLVMLTSGDDPPLAQAGMRWFFVDVIDGWDVLGTYLVAEDIDVLLEHAVPVLTEVDPMMHVTGEQRLEVSLEPTRPRRRHSSPLRNGIATTIAVLGSLIGDSTVGGRWTGQAVANRVVRELLHGANADRWLTLSSHLPLLAEAAPTVFLDAVEQSLKLADRPVMALFNEVGDGFGQLRSRHSPLLWALETLAFSRELASRVATLLARLTELDPGGQLANRPFASLIAILHLRVPQGRVDASNRLDVVDAVRRAVPAVAPKVMSKLITGHNSGMLIRNGPRYRAWPTPRMRSTYGDIFDSVDGLTVRIIEDASKSGEWRTVADLIGHVTPAGRMQSLNALAESWGSIDPEAQAEISKVLAGIADRHRQFPEARWSMRAEGAAELEEFLARFGALDASASDASLFGWWPKAIDMSTEVGREEAERRRVEIATKTARNGGIDAVRELARAVEAGYSVGYALAKSTDELDEQILDLLDAEDPKERDAAVGLVSARAQTPGWLAAQVRARSAQAAALLLSVEVTDETLELVDAAPKEQQSLFWSRVNPYRSSDDVLARFVDGLLAADRPYSAIHTVSMRNAPAPAEVALAALRAPMSGTQEHPRALQSPEYVIGSLFDQLEVAGVDSDDLARLELFYLPLLTGGRKPRTLQTKLATDAEFFADVVAQVYRPDDDAEDPVGDLEESTGSEADKVDTDEHQFSHVCWELLHGWQDPMPGTAPGASPHADLMHAWVTKAREALAVRRRAGVASMAIGEALAGTATDEDGTWPCLAVREVLEREQDDDLELHLSIARQNQRGVTVRGPYDGGTQERELAGMYRSWADAVRDRWPRSGKLLDEIAEVYEADARREDTLAERYMRE
ncbi:hypothetical protein ABZV93_04470 [Actinopolymorpha sp. NPDC004070]|uniref:hypothetical protein n=1 Tax=Actinopolymorpha sp. NPDC004070 TaxID=3154548 RepID=UPI0033ABB4C7